MKYIFILASSSVLDASKGVDLGQFIQVILGTVCLLIDSVVYWVTSLAFKLFLAISQFELFNTSTFNDIIDRTYVVIGVVSLFLVAYALLNAIINPDNFSKGDKSISKIVKNLIIAVIGIAIVPTLFNYFYYFQKVILCNNTIPKLLLKNVSDDGNTVENTAKEFSALVFESFFYPNAASSVGDEAVDLTKAAASVKLEKEDPYYGENKNDRDYNDDGYYSLSDAYFNAEKGRSFWISFSPFLLGEGFANGIVDNSVQYLVILSTIAGGYIAYVMISLCIDMGMRAVKLGYLELIAPLAIMTTIVPGKDSVYKNWIKKTTSCALEVFTRLFVVVFAVYLINTIKDMNLPSWISSVCGITLWPIAGLLLRTLVIASIFAFIKQAPKFFSEATGIKSDGFKIGIMDKLKENGMLQGLGAAGGGITAGVRNMAPGITQGIAKGIAKGGIPGGIFGGIGGGIKSLPTGLAGAASGTRRGWNKAKDAKKWSDVKTAAGDAADEAMEAKLKRQDYKESHGGTMRGAMDGHIQDAWDKVKDYPISHAAAFNFESKRHQSADEIINAEDAINSKIKSLLESKQDYLTGEDNRTLRAIRKAKEDAEHSYEAAETALAQAKVRGDKKEIERAIAAKNEALAERNKASEDVINAEKHIKKQLRLGTKDSEIGDVESGQLVQLYEKYHTAVKNNYNSLSNNQPAFEHAKAVLKAVEEGEDFRNYVESKPRTYTDADGNKVEVKFIDDVKVADAETLTKMNRENDAIKKQHESKK